MPGGDDTPHGGLVVLAGELRSNRKPDERRQSEGIRGLQQK
jgi:hypothetical protein